MSRLYTRTSDEAHIYMDQHPCACGDIDFDRVPVTMKEGGVPCSRYYGKCRTCRTMREFVFEVPPTPRPFSPLFAFGGDDPSRLLDPGEWMAISDYYAKLEPNTLKRLHIARAALEEVTKFLPPGVDRVPDEAFWTERGRAVREREPERFSRARLESLRHAYLEQIARLDLSETAVVWTHTGDAEFPYTAEVRGRRFTIRVNDFPAEPMYTLLADGLEQQDLEDWPRAWVKPGIPQALLDLLDPK